MKPLELFTTNSQVMKPHEGCASYSKAARQFLLKWSFYTSMVIRDLTLRSAASFGSFHLIRLLFDEFVFYLIERSVSVSLYLSVYLCLSLSLFQIVLYCSCMHRQELCSKRCVIF